MKSYYKYVEDVLSKKVTTGENIKLACQRFKDDLKRDDLVFKESVVDRAISFIGIFKHFKGSSSNKPFKLEDWQAFIIANIVGWYWKADGNRRFTSSYIEVARKNGKALSLDTPIPTVGGWTTMGEIKVGDKILGRDGNVTTVNFVTPIKYNHDCYKITFEDGETVIADREHNWFVKRKEREMVITTEQMLDDYVKYDSNGGKRYTYRVPMNQPLDLPQKDLPIEPYSLGQQLANLSLEELESIDLKGDKASIYLRASKEQRLSLLQGYMDNVGYINKTGQCKFTKRESNLIDYLCELLSSLGIKYTQTTIHSGKSQKEVQFINFYTSKELPCFRDEDKFDKLKDFLGERMLYKSIVEITKVDSVPVRCITVDNPEHLYLFGKHFTATHNTALAAALCLYFLIADGEDGAEVDLAANSKEQAKLAFEFCSAFSKQIDPKSKYLNPFRDSILMDANHSKLKVFAADDSKLDGFNASFGLVDEYHSAKTSKVRDVIKSSMGMRQNPHLCTITTAGFDKTLPCYKLRTTAIEILNGLKQDDSMFIAIYSLDDDDDWTIENNWKKANPNLGVTVQNKFLNEQVISAINTPSEEVGVKTKNFNIWCDSSAVWIPDRYIIKASQKINLFDFKDEICYIGVDLSATSDLTAVCYLISKDGKFYAKVFYYLPQSCLTDNANRELYKNWKNQGLLTVTQGNVTDYDYITKDMLKYRDYLTITSVGYDKWNATQWAIDATTEGLPLEEYSQTIGNFNQPTKELERLMLSGKIIIDNNEITRWCFSNVSLKEDYNDNCKPIKSSKLKKIDGVIAIIQSLGMYLLKPTQSNEMILI